METAVQDSPAPRFDYERAFSRNIGWVTELEQQMLRHKRIAIAGLGGVGGVHVTTLARTGIGALNIADFDRFEIHNFNRQAGATMASLGQSKLEVMTRAARDINPEIEVRGFAEGVTDENLDRFLEGVDMYVDALDFFVIEMRRKVFARCRELGIPAITAAPIGMGTGYLVFLPDSMSFEDYFRFEGKSEQQKRLQFLLGLTPRALHRHYLVDPSKVDLEGKAGPSTGLACMLCAGVTAAEVIKCLLKRGTVKPAPYYRQFDAYTGRWAKGWLPGGNGNPLQRLRLMIVRRMLAKKN